MWSNGLVGDVGFRHWVVLMFSGSQGHRTRIELPEERYFDNIYSMPREDVTVRNILAA